MNKKIKIHLWISIIIFIILFFVRFRFTNERYQINYGDGGITLGSLFLLFFGIYLIFISLVYFKNIFWLWKNKSLLKKNIFKAYLLLLFFCLLITLLHTSNNGRIIGILLNIKMSPIDFFFEDFPSMFFLVGLSIVFPISIYIIYQAVKVLIISKKEKQSLAFGIFLLAFNSLLLITSIISFFLVLIFWFKGGPSL